jgi:hypothetical protein
MSTDCPAGLFSTDAYSCSSGLDKCCMACSEFLNVEVTGPTPVPGDLSCLRVWPVIPTPTGSGVPAVTSDIAKAIVPVGVAQPGNQDGCDTYNFSAGVTGFIALVQRGNCTFSQKIANADTAGATAIIIYNNTVVGTDDFEGDGSIPAVAMEQNDGNSLYTFVANNFPTPGSTVVIHPGL